MIHEAEWRANEQGLPQRVPHTSHGGCHETLLICIPGFSQKTRPHLKPPPRGPTPARHGGSDARWAARASRWDLRAADTCSMSCPPGAMYCHGVPSRSRTTNDLRCRMDSWSVAKAAKGAAAELFQDRIQRISAASAELELIYSKTQPWLNLKERAGCIIKNI